MAKKRKTSSSKCSDQDKRNGGTSDQFGTSTASSKVPFESFPLHLFPDPLNGNSKTGSGSGGSSLKVQELHPGRVWVIPNFFSRKECREWVNFCESSGGLEYTAHPATNFTANRECFRMQQHDASELATRIFQRLRGGKDANHGGGPLKRVQQESGDLYPATRVPIGCNPNFRVYKYTKGHAFGKHVDGNNIIGREGGNALHGCSTEMTMLVYLTECSGGATRFHTGRRKAMSKNKSSSFAFQPQVGALLLHVHGDHCLEHEADPVIDGFKYVLRTDLVYS
ncbi:MAG: hypothetical protein SGILL_002702 [Bacillariaceae sp.]